MLLGGRQIFFCLKLLGISIFTHFRPIQPGNFLDVQNFLIWTSSSVHYNPFRIFSALVTADTYPRYTGGEEVPEDSKHVECEETGDGDEVVPGDKEGGVHTVYVCKTD